MSIASWSRWVGVNIGAIGFKRGGDSGRGRLRLSGGRSCRRLARPWLASSGRSLSGWSRRLIRLRLGLRGGLSLVRLWLEKELVAQKHDDHQQGECHCGAHVAAAAAAGARRLKIWIANFGQRILPVVVKLQTLGLPLLLW